MTDYSKTILKMTLYKAPFPKQGHRSALGQSSSKSGHTLVLVCTKISQTIYQG